MNFKQSLIDNDTVRLQAHAADWREAIGIGTSMLEASGAVEPRYHAAIIRSIEKMGAYFVIAPGLALPHARPEDGVKRTAFALVTLATPVRFEGEDEPVDVLITLAGSTSDEHIEGLMEVTQTLEDESSPTGINLDRLRTCRSKDEVYRAIDNALAQAAKQEG
ncbi:PTS ascorbate-specific transporter subunit IIA [Lonsdalea britannica]|uniref:Ascorbate-specific PTS system EIIA component n=1 Tax=Lonsdalea britannica TaxID=1082704 RepID=A0AAD0WK58_9GAMM|nr:PTS sugar transporter subunit IIA [Lonsdalea britannica]AXW86524.1 PTS ascorbate-specific transporter subunit IIA [Lonsdalea britannica]OSM98704.1 PTS ascorbate-specific transporter subunit IIA [Lonsdalea britannica]OSN09719.1 PTS ascorbate-specific transporter subunit IIA [Lonsdalea britannica]